MVKKNTNGFTLVELLIVVGIVGALALVTPPLITSTTKFFILSRTKIELQREARAAMYIITRELRQAQSNTIAIDRSGSQPYYSRIRFTKIQGQAVTVYQNGSSLIYIQGTNPATLTSNLAYMAFTFPQSDDMTILSVSMTLQKQIYGGAFKALHMASERVRVMN
jgi:uncharacterized protein (TIGR02599 family)